MKPADLVLVHMPFGSLSILPLGMGALLAAVRKRNLSAAGYYPGFLYIEMLGYDFYSLLYTHTRSEGLGNMFFSHSLFRHRDRIADCLETLIGPARGEFEAAVRDRFGLKADVPALVDHLLSKTEAFLEAAADETLSRNPSIVACSVLENQHASSLAFLKRIKEKNPGVTTIMGGPAVFGLPGLATVKNFPWIDYVFSGEGDEAFPLFCGGLLRSKKGGLSRPELPEGFLDASFEGDAVPVARVSSLEGLPAPDFSDYFAALDASGLREEIKPILTYESARGCWKGKASLCRFCGLSYDTVDFRAKSPKKVLREILALRADYSIDEIYFTESIIDMRIFRDLLPALAARSVRPSLFFQTPSALSWPQIEEMAAAGVSTILPGIETLQDDLLGLLNKGTAAVDNIALLKYAASAGLTVAWNLLVAIPGEEPSHYEELAELLPLLYHFDPPAVSSILFQRNAYYWRHPEEFAFALVPSPFYSDIYPGMEDFLAAFADTFSVVDHERYFSPASRLRRKIEEIAADWRGRSASAERPRLFMRNASDGVIEIYDSRPCASALRYRLDERESAVYRLLWEPIHPDDLAGLLFLKGWEGGGTELTAVLDGFVERKIAVRMKETCLGLAAEWSERTARAGRNDAFFRGTVNC